MKKVKFHRDFKLNGVSFSSEDEVINYSAKLSSELYQFLKNWFSDDSFILVNTSGSTGKPKKIKLQKKQMINSAFATGNYFDLKENTSALLCLSVRYIAGKMMLVRALTLGWHLDVVETNSFPLKEIQKEYDFSAMVPLQLENSLDKIHFIKKLIVGGGVVSSNLQEKIQSANCNVYATYGMTETITHIAIKKLNNINLKPSFYNVLPNVEIYKDGRSCLVIKALNVSDEIVFTNDIVDLISDTQFNWLGRYDNVINSGGVKLHPEIIEEKLTVIISNRFFVTGIPDEKLGKKLVLVVEGQRKEICFSNSSLSKFETPKEVYFINEFIETETKKIQRSKTLDLIKY